MPTEDFARHHARGMLKSIKGRAEMMRPRAAERIWQKPPLTGIASESTSTGFRWVPVGTSCALMDVSTRRFEATLQRRPRYEIYHSGLEVFVPEGRYTIEQTPASAHGEQRGVVGIGPIGAEWLGGRVRMFRYELRRWRDGVIPDIQ
jgi:hypothetical protein